jgi:hypothetical protein
MTSSSQNALEHRTDERSDPGGVTPILDWLVGGAIVLIGGLLAIVGVVVRNIDHAELSETLTEAGLDASIIEGSETITVAAATIDWTGLGLIASGAILVLGGVGYAGLQYQRRRETNASGRIGCFWTNAVLGAVVSIVFSFVPLSQILGGGVASYLDQSGSGRVALGAVSGALTVVPGLLMLPFAWLAISNGSIVVGDTTVGAEGVVLLGGGLLIGALIGAVLGAIGGYAGGHLAD